MITGPIQPIPSGYLSHLGFKLDSEFFQSGYRCQPLTETGGLQVEQVKIAKHFGVSRATVQDWRNKGCPVSGDAGDIASWRVKRDLQQEGVAGDPAYKLLPALIGELERKRAALDARIDMLNGIPDDSKGDNLGPHAMQKVVGLRVAMLEEGLLSIPARILNTPEPETLPVRLIQAVLEILDEARDETGNKKEATS